MGGGEEDEEAAYIASRLLKPADPADGQSVPALPPGLSDDSDAGDSDDEPEELSTRAHPALDADIEGKTAMDETMLENGPDDARVDLATSNREGDAEQHAARQQQRDCNNWVQTGKCRFGKECRYKHDPAKKHVERARPQPAAAPKNPFERDDLVGKLLHNEVKHQVSDLVQVIDFLARNQWLENVELYPGQKEEIEGRIQVIKPTSEEETEEMKAAEGEDVA